MFGALTAVAAVIGPFVARYRAQLIALGLAAAIVGGVYWKGRADCRAKYERAAAKIEAEWKERVREADASAYERGLRAAAIDAENEEVVNEIEEAAAAEPGADDVCLSADVVERLRALR